MVGRESWQIEELEVVEIWKVGIGSLKRAVIPSEK